MNAVLRWNAGSGTSRPGGGSFTALARLGLAASRGETLLPGAHHEAGIQSTAVRSPLAVRPSARWRVYPFGCSMSTGGRSCTCCLVMLRRIPSSIHVTALPSVAWTCWPRRTSTTSRGTVS
jgi:hypothetical protein